MTEIYLVRHGQSQGNLQNLFIGHSDPDLTEFGYQQAEIVADFLDNIHIDGIYTSDLSRAYHTAEVTAKRKGLPVHCREDLRELYAGKWEQAVYAQIGSHWPEEFRLWNEDFGNCHCPGGESILQFRERITAAVENVAKANPGKTICIFSHAVAIRVLTAAWKGLTLDQLQNHPWASNCSISRGIYDDGKFALLEYSRDDFMGASRTAFD